MLLTMLLITFPLTDTTKVLYSVFPIIFCCISEFENRFGSLSAAKSALLAWLTSETIETVQSMQEKKERDHG